MKTKIAVVLTTLIAAPLFAQSPRSTIKAIVFHEFGGPEVLKYEDVPKPEPQENEVLISVIAAGVNPGDGMDGAGMVAEHSQNAVPIMPGSDVAGLGHQTGETL